MKFDEEEFALPRYAQSAASYEREIAALDGRVLLTFDAVFPNDDDVREHIGGEYSYRRMVALRAGYKVGHYDSRARHLRRRLRWHEIGVDYAFLPVSDDLGDNHRFGLSFSF